MREDITVREFKQRRNAAMRPVRLSRLEEKCAWMRARQAEREAVRILKQYGREVSLASTP